MNCSGESIPSEAVTYYFRRDLRHLINAAIGSGVQPVLSTVAYSSDNPNEDLLAFNEVVRELAAEHDVPFYDLITNLEDTSEYWQGDYVHQTVAGTRAQAEHYARFLHENELIPGTSD